MPLTFMLAERKMCFSYSCNTKDTLVLVIIVKAKKKFSFGSRKETLLLYSGACLNGYLFRKVTFL